MKPTSARVQQAASENHAKHRAWWDSVCRAALGGIPHWDYLERAELQLRLKYAYEDYARYRWDEDLLLSEQWINQVSPEDFLEWVRWHPNPDWDSKVATFLQSPEFKERVYLLEAKLEADASEVFRYNTEKRR